MFFFFFFNEIILNPLYETQGTHFFVLVCLHGCVLIVCCLVVLVCFLLCFSCFLFGFDGLFCVLCFPLFVFFCGRGSCCGLLVCSVFDVFVCLLACVRACFFL